MPSISKLVGAGAALVLALAACGGSSSSGTTGSGGGTGTNTGATCTKPDQCYPGLDQTMLSGAAECLDQVPGGYCTHACTANTDCCALAGECPDQRAVVCASFESSGAEHCFLSCEGSDVQKAGLTDSTAYCQKYANAAFTCHSTGGGSQNRKACLPTG